MFKKIKAFFIRVYFWFKHGFNLVEIPYEETENSSDLSNKIPEGDGEYKFNCGKCKQKHELYFHYKGIEFITTKAIFLCPKLDEPIIIEMDNQNYEKEERNLIIEKTIKEFAKEIADQVVTLENENKEIKPNYIG